MENDNVGISKFKNNLLWIHPLGKLKGFQQNNSTRVKLPTLSEITEDYADDLLMAIDDVFDVSKEKDNEWKKTRIRLVIATKIIERLQELN